MKEQASGNILRCFKHFVVLLLSAILFAGCVHHGTTWREYKVFCGMSNPAGEVTEEAWRRFCEEHVTAAFPDGYTVLPATGYWRSGKDTIIESSRVILVLAPTGAEKKVRALAEQYRRQFSQECVIVTASENTVDFVEKPR